jgi:hypothetical protein
MIGRRGLLSGFMASAAALALREATEAKDPKSGGFGATASVSVNSGNNSGNQTANYQENQAILTVDSAGNLQVQQGNAVDGSVQQGQAVSTLPSTGDGQCGCDGPVPPGCGELGVIVDGVTIRYIPVRCLSYYCQGGSPGGS